MTYEYQCSACGHEWEAEQSIKDAPLDTCVSCGQKTAKRLVSGGTGFLLKGGGWYADGYGSAKSPAAGPAESGSSSTDSSAASEAGASSTASTKEGAGSKEGASSASTKESKSPSSGSAGGKSTAKAS